MSKSVENIKKSLPYQLLTWGAEKLTEIINHPILCLKSVLDFTIQTQGLVTL